MHRAQSRSPIESVVQRDRRLVAGIVVSVLLHALLLSLQFGVPGFDAGSGGPIQVRLAPSLPSPPPETLPARAASPTLPTAVLPPEPAAPPATGLRVVDPLPQPVELAQAPTPTPAARKPARRLPPRRRAPVAPPVIASTQLEAPFAVAPPLPEIEPDTVPGLVDGEAEEKTLSSASDVLARDDAAQEQAAREEEEGKRLAAAEQQQRLEMETERQRRLRDEQERLAAAERDAVVLRERAELAQRETQQREEQRRAGQLRTEQLQAEQRLAEQLSEQQRLAVQQQAAQRAQQQRLAEQEMDARRRNEAELQRMAQLREREEALARQEAQQAAAERLAVQEAERIAVQEQLRAQERRRAEELAQRQAAEGAARQAEERAQAERLAQQRADEAGRQAAAERLAAQDLPGSGSAGAAGPGGPGAGNGEGRRQASSVPGGATASRARELLRGLSIPNVAPPPPRPFDTMTGTRRVLADGAERDPPLRLYVDSVRQKLERNAVLGGARFALPEVRIDPLVSIALRSDGSVDQITIVRSSGRAETDDAVRRFILLNARYSVFPPNVSARFDVIEIRRVWRFADGLKLLEEMR